MFLSPYRSYQLYYEYTTSNVASLQAFRQLKEGYVWRLYPYYTNFFMKLLVPELEAPTQVAKVHPEWASWLQQFMKHASGPMKSWQAIVEIWWNWMKFVEVPWGQEVYLSLSLSLSLFLYISLPQEFSWTFRHYVRGKFPILAEAQCLIEEVWFEHSRATHGMRNDPSATSGPELRKPERCRCDW